MPVDARQIGWWIQSADEEVYGPVSRHGLRHLLRDGVISANTLVRHCTSAQWGPVADQPGLTEGLELPAVTVGDRLEGCWPGSRSERRQLAEGPVPCWRHNRPAVLVCVRCQAPYCHRCRMRPRRRRFFLCRRCQANIYNRRVAALILDSVLINGLLWFAVSVPIGFAAMTLAPAFLSLWYLSAFLLGLFFVFRDAVFHGAGPCKRLLSLRVVHCSDGRSPLSYGQAFVRWIPMAIPFFNLVDAAVAYRDPLLRRYGDRWGKTRVIDTPPKLERVRAKVRRRLARKGVEFTAEGLATMEQFARFAV